MTDETLSPSADVEIIVDAEPNPFPFAVASTALILIVSTMAAYAFGRLRFRLGRSLFYAVLATMLVPVFVVAVTLFQVMADLHLIDTKRGLTLVFLATLSPLATWLRSMATVSISAAPSLPLPSPSPAFAWPSPSPWPSPSHGRRPARSSAR